MSDIYSPLDGDEVKGRPPENKPEETRWWVLFLYVMLSVVQGASWNQYAPVADSLETAYGPSWDGAFISLLLNVANGVFLVMLQPTSVAIDR